MWPGKQSRMGLAIMAFPSLSHQAGEEDTQSLITLLSGGTCVLEIHFPREKKRNSLGLVKDTSAIGLAFLAGLWALFCHRESQEWQEGDPGDRERVTGPVGAILRPAPPPSPATSAPSRPCAAGKARSPCANAAGWGCRRGGRRLLTCR